MWRFAGMAVVGLVGCDAERVDRPDEPMGTAYAGGEVVLTWTLDEGRGFEGTVVVEGTDAATVELADADDRRAMTGMHVFPWTDEQPWMWFFNVGITPDTDLSGLSHDLVCVDPDAALRGVRLNHFTAFYESYAQMDLVEYDEAAVMIARDHDFQFPQRPAPTGRFDIPIEWLGRDGDDCATYEFPREVGRGTLTVEWDLTESWEPTAHVWRWGT